MPTTQSLDEAEWINQLLQRASIGQLRILRDRIDIALIVRADEVRRDEEQLKLKKKEAKETLKALGIKKPRKTRSDKGSKRKRYDQLTGTSEDKQQ